MVAVLRDADGNVLINQRPAGKMQAGRWEFPGGKLEPGEGRFAGLARELQEELGVSIVSASPLVRVRHQYPEINVLLDVMQVDDWQGNPASREQQALKWVAPEQLPFEDILEADKPIIQSIRLPDKLLVTPDTASESDFLQQLNASLAGGIRLVQFRAPSLADDDYRLMARKVAACCEQHHADLILNRSVDVVHDIPSAGLHLSSAQLYQHTSRPVPVNQWLSVACHSRHDLERAREIDADFALLSPVNKTQSHPECKPLGWERFAEWVDAAQLPVFALGGMQQADVVLARRHGGQGIAAIRGLWATA